MANTEKKGLSKYMYEIKFMIIVATILIAVIAMYFAMESFFFAKINHQAVNVSQAKDSSLSVIEE